MPETLFRLSFVAILVLNVSISGYHRKRAQREEAIPRSRESAGLRALRVAMTVPILAAVLAYLIHPPWMAWSRLPLGDGLRLAAVAFGVTALPLLIHWTLRTLGANVSETVLTKESHELVTGGPYRWVRHPLYLVGTLLNLVLALVAANAFLLGAAFVVLALVRLAIVPREEEALEARFGEPYRHYRSRTGALLPRLPA